MSEKLSRISCTIPRAVLLAADRLATREQRSRSWVISEALRRYTAATESAAPAQGIRESAAPVYETDAVAEGRTRRLRHDLELLPAERLARAEDLLALGRAVRPRRLRAQVIGFDSLEDFGAWKRANRARA